MLTKQDMTYLANIAVPVGFDRHTAPRALLLAVMALSSLAPGTAGARVDPLQVVRERLVRPEIMIVMDTSGSMAWRPSSSTAIGNDCGGNRTGSVDLCGDGMCSGTEGSRSNPCTADCNITRNEDGLAGSPPRCNPRQVISTPSRMEMVKRVLHNVLPDLRRSANFGMVSFRQSGYYRYYRMARTGTPKKVSAFFSHSVMRQLGAWDAAGKPRSSFVHNGTRYDLLSSSGLTVDRDSLYVRIDDLSRYTRYRWSSAGMLHFDGSHNWKYRGSYYTYLQYPLDRYSTRIEQDYKGPQFVDSLGVSWIYHRFDQRYTAQGISHGSSGLVVESLAGLDDQLVQDQALFRIMGRLAPAANGGFWAWGNTPTGPAIETAATHFRDRYQGTGPFAGVGPDPSAACRPRYVLLLTDGQSNSGVTPWYAAKQAHDGMLIGSPVKTLVIGLPGLPGSAVSELDRIADMGDDGKSNHSATAYLASDETALVRVINEALLEMVRGDYTTTPVSVATVGDTLVAGNVALIPSTEYPGWRGHLRAVDLRVKPHARLWDAGQILQQRSYNTRRLFSGTPSVNNGDPVPMLSTDGKVNLGGGCAGCGSVGLKQVWSQFGKVPGDAQITGMVLWLAGKDRPWKLGPVLRTIPATVGRPPRYDLPGHSSFRSKHASRETLVYVTSNHGLLHAFRARDGSEAFAYMPPNLLPTLHALWRQGGQAVEITRFKWLLASSPRVEDFPPASAPQSWSTRLVLTMGPGGAAYTVLDITNPSSCTSLACTLNDPPFSLVTHSRSVATAGVMGETWSNPSIYHQVDPSSGTRQAHAAMGSGYGSGSQGNFYNRFTSLASAPDSAEHPHPGGVMDYALLTDTAASVDRDSEMSVVATYQGDLAGRLVRYHRGDPARGAELLAGGLTRPLYYSPAIYYRGSQNALLAAASGTHDETLPQARMEAMLYLRSETAGVVDSSSDNLSCQASQICSQAPGCPTDVGTNCKAPGARAMPVGPPLILKNRISNEVDQFEAFYLLYEPPSSSCGLGSSWLIRLATDGTNQRLISSDEYSGIRATGITLVGGGIDLAVAHVGEGGKEASVFTVMRDTLPTVLPGTAPYLEGWKEVSPQALSPTP